MADGDDRESSRTFDDELERTLRGEEPTAPSAATAEELATARLLASRLARLREVPPGVRERIWASTQARRATEARTPRWQRLSGSGLAAGANLLVAAAVILLALQGALPWVQELPRLLRPGERGSASRIAFVSERDGNAEIYAIEPDGSGLTRLTHHPAFDGDPAWSPDGQRIAFRSQRDGNNEIYVMNADGTGVRRLTHHPADDLRPVWSPDGRQIAFLSNRDGSPGLYVMNADGSDVRRLADGPAADAALAWAYAR
jgi:hypothetical protein